MKTGGRPMGKTGVGQKERFSFQFPGKVIFGDGALQELPAVIREIRSRHPLLVSGITLSKTPVMEMARYVLDSSGIRYGVFDRVEPEPPVESVAEAAIFARNNGHDLMIGLGGGSTMDFTKVASVMAMGEMDIMELVGRDKVPGKGLPTVMLPTTSGSGSEVSPVAIFTFSEEKVKKGVVSPFLIPDAAIVDPELTWSVPGRVTADTGMDAMVHAVESFLSVNSNPFSEALSLEALKNIACSLERAFRDGQDAEARRRMSLGSLLAGMAFAMAGTAAVHALAYPLGGEFHIPHGTANTVMLRPVMEFNMDCCEGKIALLARAVTEDRRGHSEMEESRAFIDWMTETALRTGVVTRLRDLGIPASAIPGMADAASGETRLLSNNPKPLDRSDIETIYRKAW